MQLTVKGIGIYIGLLISLLSCRSMTFDEYDCLTCKIDRIKIENIDSLSFTKPFGTVRKEFHNKKVIIDSVETLATSHYFDSLLSSGSTKALFKPSFNYLESKELGENFRAMVDHFKTNPVERYRLQDSKIVKRNSRYSLLLFFDWKYNDDGLYGTLRSKYGYASRRGGFTFTQIVTIIQIHLARRRKFDQPSTLLSIYFLVGFG